MKKTLMVVAGLMLALCFVSLMSNCSLSPKKYVVGIINPRPPGDELVKGFVEKLNSYGYLEGKNLTLVKYEEAKIDIDLALKDMINKKADLVLSVTTPVTSKAKEMSEKTDIPVVFAVFNPVESNIVSDIKVPGNTITGVQLGGSVPKAVEWLLKIKPDIKKIFAPIVDDTEASRQSNVELKNISSKLKIELVDIEIKSKEELFKYISSLDQSFDAIFITHSILLSNSIEKIIELASAKKIIVATSGSHYNKGAVMSYGTNRYHSGEQLGRIGHMILQGTSTRQIPVEIAKFFLGINLKTAAAIGLDIDKEILLQADFIAK